MRFRLAPTSVAFTLLLAALVTLASFATDMGLPVLADTAASLRVTPATAALTMSVFMAGFAIGPLIMGPLSDRHGRRPLLLLGCATFALFGALGAFAQSLPALLTWRFAMGAGAGTAQVLVLATVRDVFTGREARVRQSYINLAAGMAPVIAPTLGVWVAGVGGWRAIYGALAAGGIVLLLMAALFLHESAQLTSASTLTMSGTLRSFARVLSHPVSVGYALVVAFLFGCLFSYVSGSSLVLIGLMGVSRRAYGLLFAVTAIGLVTGSFTNARLNRLGVSHTLLITVGLGVVVSISLALLVLAWLRYLDATTLVGAVLVSFVGHAVVRANAAQGALEPMPEIAGVASAVLTGLTTVFGATASAIAASLFDGHSAVAMTGTMTVCSASAFAVYMFVVRPAERRGRVATLEAGVRDEVEEYATAASLS